MSDPETVASEGIVVRVVGDSLGYVTTTDNSRTLAFVPDVIAGYAGERLADLDIRPGTRVNLEWKPDSGIVMRVGVVRAKAAPGGVPKGVAPPAGPGDDLPEKRQQPPPSATQLELHPDRAPKSTSVARRALPPQTRQFGRLVDTRNLRPGDLLLARELAPDDISSRIASVQKDGGYAEHDSRWTHAAMYVGDDHSIVEATFDSVTAGGSVRLTSLDEYCDGKNAMRFRRSRFMTADRDGWRVCVRALSRLKEPYSFAYAVQMWINVVFRKKGFYSSDRQRPEADAIVCSTLYADAYNEAMRRSLGEVNGACVPAWLSAADEFEDVQAEWVGIV